MKEQITKNQLIQIIEDWGTKKITCKEFSEWVEKNYLPLHKDIGINEPLHTQKAMHAILNGFDHFSPERIVPEQYRVAIELINSSENDLESNQSNFFNCCFK